ncbi:hypothetical protein G3O87_001011 [Salmonella enterica]|uniref:hypothetical protein n=1 Tax=Salmonella enterica TaxID=28901 RepID=UPI000D56A344|nr:hypothetical protein [Salmonella enterica]EBM2051393.1 hypothetical protein [Salmonella enterica]ECS0374316.1 hypothetical protein [Salmonella enterica]ECZ1434913.1 hypothetical protein [Salmonella enterica]EDC5855996.1 hypothetical protein [Salmonella enterica]EDR2086928.1 hypothetical protein [Salmonella enterica]
MTTITREQLIEKLQNRIAVTANYPGVEEAQLDAAIFKIALASLEAEPVSYNQVQRDMMKDIIVRKMGGNLAGEKLVMDDIHAVTMALIDAGFRTAPPVPVVPEGLVKAVRFYEQVKRENPPVETGAWKDAVDWVLKEACKAVSMLESSREHEVISQQEKA